MSDKYILDNKTPVAIDTSTTEGLLEWGKWMETNNRIVEKTRLEVTQENRFTMKEKKVGFVEVSTVFLGLDHAFFGREPLLFETMIFGGEHEGQMDRCSTWEQAEKMHWEMVGKLKGSFDS